MSIARGIAAILADSNTFTIYGGYCVKAGKTIRFQTGRPVAEKRNALGHMLRAEYEYADGSRLTYTRKPDNQFSLTVKD